MFKAHDVRIETIPDPVIVQPTDAVICVTRACICGTCGPIMIFLRRRRANPWDMKPSASWRTWAPTSIV